MVIVPGIPTIPKHSELTTDIVKTSEFERVQKVLTELRLKRVVEYEVIDQPSAKLDNPLELATVQDVIDGAGAGNWTGAGRRFYQRALSGPINGINTTFLAPAAFVTNGEGTEVVYMNGVAQARGLLEDYEIAESSPGNGYDTILLSYPPKPGDRITIDFVPIS